MEYIGVNNEQARFIKKNLLYSEMELLNTLKNYRRYNELRKQEKALKKLLDTQIKETLEELKNLFSYLPKTKHDKFKAVTIDMSKRKRYELEEEIMSIKRKIAELSQQDK